MPRLLPDCLCRIYTNSYVEALIPCGNLFGDNAFKKVTKVKCGYKAGVLIL